MEVDNIKLEFDFGRSFTGATAYKVSGLSTRQRLVYVCRHYQCKYITVGRKDNMVRHLKQKHKAEALVKDNLHDESQLIKEKIHQTLKKRDSVKVKQWLTTELPTPGKRKAKKDITSKIENALACQLTSDTITPIPINGDDIGKSPSNIL